MTQRVFSFHYVLRDQEGELIDQSEADDPLHFLEGSGQIIPGLEAVVIGLNAGDKRKVDVKADEAYGVRDENLIVTVPRSNFPKADLKLGDVFQSQTSEDSEPLMFTVVKLEDEDVTLDGNHPLAGVDLSFDVTMVGVRPASSEELEHGHAHGPGGHHH